MLNSNQSSLANEIMVGSLLVDVVHILVVLENLRDEGPVRQGEQLPADLLGVESGATHRLTGHNDRLLN